MSDRYLMKFWHKERKCFVDFDNEGLYINYNNGQIYTRSGSLNITDRYVRLQCTGLKDRNGKLIYEGDLIKLCGSGEVCHVWYSDNDFTFLIDVKTHDIGLITLCFLTGYKNFEIIGNVHQHPELVEGYESKT